MITRNLEVYSETAITIVEVIQGGKCQLCKDTFIKTGEITTTIRITTRINDKCAICESCVNHFGHRHKAKVKSLIKKHKRLKNLKQINP